MTHAKCCYERKTCHELTSQSTVEYFHFCHLKARLGNVEETSKRWFDFESKNHLPPPFRTLSKATPPKHIFILSEYTGRVHTGSQSLAVLIIILLQQIFFPISFIDRCWHVKGISTNRTKNASEINCLPWL